MRPLESVPGVGGRKVFPASPGIWKRLFTAEREHRLVKATVLWYCLSFLQRL